MVRKRNQYQFDYKSGKYVKKNNIDSARQKTGILYVRVSSDIQLRDWHGIETQEEILRAWAERENIQVVEAFKDEAISWWELNRKWLIDAITFLKASNKSTINVDYFMCTELSRISRRDDLWKTYQTEKDIRATWAEIKVHINPNMFI